MPFLDRVGAQPLAAHLPDFGGSNIAKRFCKGPRQDPEGPCEAPRPNQRNLIDAASALSLSFATHHSPGLGCAGWDLAAFLSWTQWTKWTQRTFFRGGLRPAIHPLLRIALPCARCLSAADIDCPA